MTGRLTNGKNACYNNTIQFFIFTKSFLESPFAQSPPVVYSYILLACLGQMYDYDFLEIICNLAENWSITWHVFSVNKKRVANNSNKNACDNVWSSKSVTRAKEVIGRRNHQQRNEINDCQVYRVSAANKTDEIEAKISNRLRILSKSTKGAEGAWQSATKRSAE